MPVPSAQSSITVSNAVVQTVFLEIHLLAARLQLKNVTATATVTRLEISALKNVAAIMIAVVDKRVTRENAGPRVRPAHVIPGSCVKTAPVCQVVNQIRIVHRIVPVPMANALILALAIECAVKMPSAVRSIITLYACVLMASEVNRHKNAFHSSVKPTTIVTRRKSATMEIAGIRVLALVETMRNVKWLIGMLIVRARQDIMETR